MSTDSAQSSSNADMDHPQNKRVIVTMDGRSVSVNLQSDFVLADRIHDLIEADIGWIDSFTKHGAAKGTHFEAIIRDVIADQLTSPFAVSTGYVIEPSTKKCSNQVDIIVYDTSIARPLFERREFVIVDSSTVRFTCEIKATLKTLELKTWLEATIRSNLGDRFGVTPGFQDAHLFAFSSRISPQKIMEVIEGVYVAFFEEHPEVTESSDYSSFLKRMSFPTIIVREKNEFIACELHSDHFDGHYKIYLNHIKTFAKHGTGALLSALRHGTQSERFSDPNFCDFTTTSARQVLSRRPISPSFAAKYFISNHEIATRFRDGHTEIIRQQELVGQGIGGIYVPVVNSFGNYSSLLIAMANNPGCEFEYFAIE